ncbi:DsbA family protein [Marinimicrobium sp. C6131]|uniref:DsbA family protein n=1 Tax=unclassified Marinimicrobium TaxID=2632100 RepID=UPI00223DD680|nr:DsbA family protein [Marinimicrobium sp. C6131]UZJ45435.1 DsbA family protein [Marinimicrobium sp. C6131]
MRENRGELFDDPRSPVGGNPQGDITIVEFMDYNCGACRRMAPILAQAKERDPGLRIVYKEFPIRGPDSTLAAKAALAAHRQGKYVEFHKGLMEFPGQASQVAIEEAAGSLGLDMERLLAAMEDPAIARQVERNRALANTLGIIGTPAFVIGTEVRSGLLELSALESLIEHERRKRGSSKDSTSDIRATGE